MEIYIIYEENKLINNVKNKINIWYNLYFINYKKMNNLISIDLDKNIKYLIIYVTSDILFNINQNNIIFYKV